MYQNSAAQTAGPGTGVGFLDGEAAPLMRNSKGVYGGCSGSLVGGGAYVLTAAHCLTDALVVDIYFGTKVSFSTPAGQITSSDYILVPAWDGPILDDGDLALIKLPAKITSVTSYELDTTSSAVGQQVILAGYGYTGVGSTGAVSTTFGTLRYGANVYDGVFSDRPSDYEYDFDQYGNSAYNKTGGGAVGTNEAMIAPGNSGGASLMQVDGVWKIADVHDFSYCFDLHNCTFKFTFGQGGGDTSVYANRDWLESVLAAPEPRTAELFATGLVGLAVIYRRRV